MVGMIVTAHQPNYLPGLSVTEKVRVADVCIWLDDVQFSKGGWTNRNRLCDGVYLTVPVDRSTLGGPISGVRVCDATAWRFKHEETLGQRFGWNETARLRSAICGGPDSERLVRLNWRCLRILFPLVGIRTAHVWQSTLDSGLTLQAESDDPSELAPISERLAAMVAEVGGRTYLSGPSGRDYLDEEPFRRRGVEVVYFRYDGPLHSCVEEAFSREAIAA